MSMYDLTMADGNQQSRGALLLAILGNPDVGRYRDSWVEQDAASGDPLIVIYTRNGGGNREHEGWGSDGCGEGCTACAGEKLTEHPAYLRDEDDEFDCTYATYWFRVLDDEARDLLRPHAGEKVDMSQRWQDMIARLGAGSPCRFPVPEETPMNAPLENVNEILARRLTAAGLDADRISEAGEVAVAALVPGIDAVLPSLEHDPYALRVLAECLRSYGDLCESYAAAREADGSAVSR